ncbi:MAG: cell division protein FtsA [Lentisphaerae bacterium]|nr:MAG: cell division protein FtsA [Lentisphaerota bacterium]
MATQYEHVTALDIGTASIKAVMARISPLQVESILACASEPSCGHIRKGEIMTIAPAFDIITEVLYKLEKEARHPVENLYLAISGSHIESHTITGSTPITNPDRCVTDLEYAQAVQNAQCWHKPPGKFCINVYQCYFEIDGAIRYKDPRGMVGNRLTAHLHTVYAERNRIEGLLRLLHSMINDKICELIFSGIADYYGMEPVRNQEQGVLTIDIGKGITDFSLFHENTCVHSGQIAVGCDHAINDLALAFHIPFELAADLFVQRGAAIAWIDEANREICIPTSTDCNNMIPEAVFNRIVELRFEELFQLIRNNLEEYDKLKFLGRGVAVAGGAAELHGIVELAGKVFDIPAWKAVPADLPNLPETFRTPANITPLGVIRFAQKKHFCRPHKPSISKVLRREITNVWSLLRNAFRM